MKDSKNSNIIDIESQKYLNLVLKNSQLTVPFSFLLYRNALISPLYFLNFMCF